MVSGQSLDVQSLECAVSGFSMAVCLKLSKPANRAERNGIVSFWF